MNAVLSRSLSSMMEGIGEVGSEFVYCLVAWYYNPALTSCVTFLQIFSFLLDVFSVYFLVFLTRISFTITLAIILDRGLGGIRLTLLLGSYFPAKGFYCFWCL